MISKPLRFVALLLAIPTNAPSQGLRIDWFTYAAGAGRSTGSNLEVTGTVGQSDSGSMGGGTLSLDSGFWAFLPQPLANTITAFAAETGPRLVTLTWTSEGFAPRLQSFRVGSRVAGSSGPFGDFRTIPYSGQHNFLLVTPLTEGILTEYEISESYSGFAVWLPRARTVVASYTSFPPLNTARVGTEIGTRRFRDIASAIAAATGPDWTISVQPGFYAGFTIDDNAPANLRIIGDGTGLVIIDTRTNGPITIAGRRPGKVVELRNLSVGRPDSNHPALRVLASQGVVIADSCILLGGLNQPGVQLDDAARVALQRCDIRGTPSLIATNHSQAVAGRGALDSLTVAGQSDVTVCQVVPRTLNVEPGSRFTSLSGVMPDLRQPPFTGFVAGMELNLETVPNGGFAVFLATGNEWARVPGLEMPLLLPLATLVMLKSGTADPLGGARYPLRLPNIPALAGQAFTTQFLSVDTDTGQLRFSNAQSFVIFG